MNEHLRAGLFDTAGFDFFEALDSATSAADKNVENLRHGFFRALNVGREILVVDGDARFAKHGPAGCAKGLFKRVLGVDAGPVVLKDDVRGIALRFSSPASKGIRHLGGRKAEPR